MEWRMSRNNLEKIFAKYFLDFFDGFLYIVDYQEVVMKTRIVREGRVVKEYGLVNGSWKLLRVFC
jgi:hypothetical protein